MTKDEMERRIPLWISMSKLFFDIDTLKNPKKVSIKCYESEFNINEIKTILFDEVAPICIGGLLSKNYTAFDDNVLVEKILTRLNRPKWKFIFEFRLRFIISSRLYGHWIGMSLDIAELQETANKTPKRTR